MKSLMMASAFIIALATTSNAGGLDVKTKEASVITFSQLQIGPILGGSVKVEVAENDSGDFAATTTFAAGIVTPGLAFGEIGVESVDGNTFEVNKWYIGATLGNGTVSFGDHDGGVFVSAYSDYASIADPTINEAFIATLGDASIAVGFADVTTDVTDISNVQGAYAVDAGLAIVTVSADYNFASKEYAIGTRTEGVQIGAVGLGSTLSYASATETVAYEMDATIFGVTAYVNGDNGDAFRNVGAGYFRGVGNLDVFANVNYNIDTKEVTPKAGISFNF